MITVKTSGFESPCQKLQKENDKLRKKVKVQRCCGIIGIIAGAGGAFWANRKFKQEIHIERNKREKLEQQIEAESEAVDKLTAKIKELTGAVSVSETGAVSVSETDTDDFTEEDVVEDDN